MESQRDIDSRIMRAMNIMSSCTNAINNNLDRYTPGHEVGNVTVSPDDYAYVTNNFIPQLAFYIVVAPSYLRTFKKYVDVHQDYTWFVGHYDALCVCYEHARNVYDVLCGMFS